MGRNELGRGYWAEGSGPIDLGLDRVGLDPAQGPRVVQGHIGNFTSLLVLKIIKILLLPGIERGTYGKLNTHTQHTETNRPSGLCLARLRD